MVRGPLRGRTAVIISAGCERPGFGAVEGKNSPVFRPGNRGDPGCRTVDMERCTPLLRRRRRAGPSDRTACLALNARHAARAFATMIRSVPSSASRANAAASATPSAAEDDRPPPCGTSPAITSLAPITGSPSAFRASMAPSTWAAQPPPCPAGSILRGLTSWSVAIASTVLPAGAPATATRKGQRHGQHRSTRIVDMIADQVDAPLPPMQ